MPKSKKSKVKELLDLKTEMDKSISGENLPEGVHSEGSCECFSCKYGPEFLASFEQEAIKEYGWFARYVPGASDTPYQFEYLTFGIKENFGHDDLQIVFPMDQHAAHYFANVYIENIRNGVKFVADGKTEYSDIIANGYKVVFIMAPNQHGERMRMIFPDKEGGYSGKFAKQFEI